MAKNNSKLMLSALFLIISIFAFPQEEYKPPETILSEQMIKIILNEISGQLAFNNEVMLAGYNHIRTEEEFNTFFYESDYMAKKLKEYGVEEVRLEDLGKEMPERGQWWAREDAELWMIEPEQKRLSRLAEHPALMARYCDTGEWEGEAVYLDKRDRDRLKDMDLKGKIILTPEHPALFRDVFSNGALGVVSYYTFEKSWQDPFRAVFNMRFRKGKFEGQVFCFHIWRHLGEQLKEMIYEKQKVVLRATAKTKSYPYKLDTILACIKGKAPQKKGFMFTAHLFERPLKQGANDNVSGCVVLAEIARTITTLIKEGKIEPLERSIYFLMIEEGSGTMAFFRKYPEMADKILAVINMDMVGEDLDKNQAFFFIEKAFHSSASFLEPLTVHFTDYVFKTNTQRPENQLYNIKGDFPVAIVEKNGSRQPFRYTLGDFKGSSDHAMFIETDSGIPAVMFSVWPDLWFHTDKDRPDKSDPTQLKRVAFIGAASALAVCSGSEEILEKLIRITYQDRLAFVQETLSRSIKELSLLNKSDSGVTYANTVNYINQAVILGKNSLSYIKDLTQGKKRLENYLNALIKSFDDLPAYYTKILVNYYRNVAKLKSFQPAFAKRLPEEEQLKHIIPAKVEPIPMGKWIPHSKLFGAFRKDPGLSIKIFRQYGHLYLMELYLCIDGKRDLARIRNLLSLEFQPMAAADFMKIINFLAEAELIKLKK
ncbi:MAG: M28 family peptidase [Candidatus Aminicenantes bacterium]|nr:MAG: M28 family peptidase [Candidatus Aminicenantes bacterium]